ncbi:MAG: hypothetical protein RLZZ303_1119 [Candidatus Hydrogenedentota bacterium]|jgi:hypothetical protein
MRDDDFEMPEGDELDSLIESALRSEPMLSAPMNFHRRVEERVRIVALRDYEVSRFRYSMASLVVLFCGCITMAGAIIAFTNFDLLMANGLPGGGGIYDRYAVFMSQSWSSYSGAYLFGASFILAVGTLLVALIPLGRYLRTP